MTDENFGQFEYDVVLSFAGEDRIIVEEFAHLLEMQNIKFFYDEAEAFDLWGKNLIDHLGDIYEKRARYCIMFISKDYPLKKWTNFERAHIQARAFQDPNEYILPIKLDDTEIPGLAATIGYRDLRKHSAQGIVNALVQKLAKSKGQINSASSASDVASTDKEMEGTSFGSIPMPKTNKTHTQFEKDNFARESIGFIKQYFQQALRQLETSDSNIQTAFDDLTTFDFTSRIYLHGNIKSQCRIWLGDSFMANGICYNEGVHRQGTSSINEVLSVVDNVDGLRLQLGLFGISRVEVSEKMATQQQAAEYLWKRFISPLEHR